LSWTLVLLARPEELEILSAELFDLGALGVELQEPGMPLMPGTPPLPEGRGRAIAHFDDFAAASQAAQELHLEPPLEVPEQDWSTAWRAHHRTMQVGPRSWVHPPWEGAPPGVAVTIDPGMAFGTGSHPTTSLCLERLDELLAEVPGAEVLDVGTGSGVLALLAAKLGAQRVVATENDPVALDAARAGAALNSVSSVEWLLTSDPGAAPGQFGIILANILLNTLEELAPRIFAKVAPGGRLILSGLLAAQKDAAVARYSALGMRTVTSKEREGWVRVEMSR